MKKTCESGMNAVRDILMRLYGQYYTDRQSHKKALKETAKLSCEHDFSDGCALLANFYKRNSKEYVELHKKACDLMDEGYISSFAHARLAGNDSCKIVANAYHKGLNVKASVLENDGGVEELLFGLIEDSRI